MSLEVLEPGLATQVVDMGRPSWRSLGVAEGGAADRWSLALGNGLVGNPANTAALEINLKGPTLRADTDLACVIFGAPFDVYLNDALVSPGVTFTFPAGKTLQILGPRRGMRAYLCVRGGIDAPVILDSRSALTTVRAGEVLPCAPGRIGKRFVRFPVLAPWEEPGPVRVLPGLQSDWVDMNEFLDQEFVVSSSSNRQGLRLEGRPLTLPQRELVSEPVCPGTVQVTSNGQCIVLGRDAQTIGGYPKIAQVIAADLDRLGQLRPGQRLAFVRVSLDEATSLYHERQRLLAEWLLRLRVSLDGMRHGRKLE